MADIFMVVVQSADEVRNERGIIRDRYGTVVTNFTVLPRQYEAWIKDGFLYRLTFERVSYFIHEGSRGNEVFFFADTYASVRDSLSDLQRYLIDDSIIEMVQRETASLLGIPIMVLQRMSSTVIPSVNTENSINTTICIQDELNAIEDILLAYFDPIAERIPTLDQLKGILDNPQDGGIYVTKDQDKITGLMVYSIDKSTIHLRYWWTDPSYRNQGIGSRLLNRFFQLGAECQRMILWVRTDNEETIKRYKHYGFVSEKMYDYIYKIK